jgi:WD40 repeat protein
MPADVHPEGGDAALRATLQAALTGAPPGADPVALDRLASLLSDLIAGRVTPEAAESHLADVPDLATLIGALAGREVRLDGALVAFGAGSQVGDVAIGDIAGRDLIKLTIAVTQQMVTGAQTYDVRGLANPYRGLLPFTYDARTDFAGRERLVRTSCDLLTQPGAQQALLFVTGAGGSGKSSFVQAGLIPALEAFYTQRHMDVRYAVVRPGVHPPAAFADALRQSGLPADGPFAALRPYLIGPAPQQRADTHVALLVLDQFEEIFHPQVEAAQRAIVFDVLTALPPFAEMRLHIIATLRADYLPDLFAHPALYAIAKQGVDMQAMQVEELRSAIVRPLERAHPDKRFEPGLVDRLAEEAAVDAAYLPLLQVALTDLFHGGQLALSAYSSLIGALGARADAVHDFVDYDGDRRRPRPAADRAAIMAMMLDLVRVSLDDFHRDVRRRQPYAALVRGVPAEQAQRRRLVQDLIAARLLSADAALPADGAPVPAAVAVDIIHESLITRWDRLQTALAERRAQLEQGVRFTQALAEWRAYEGRPEQDAYLLIGVRLAEAEALQLADDVVIQQEGARELITRSRRRRDADRQRQVRLARIVAGGFALLALLALGAALLAFNRQAAATASAEEAQRQARYARAAALAARADAAQAAQPQQALLLAVEALRTTLPAEPPAPAIAYTLRDLLRSTGGVALPGVAADPELAANLWLSADGAAAAFVGDDGYLHRVTIDASGTPRADPARRVGSGAVVRALLDAAGERAVTVDADGTLHAWDLRRPDQAAPIALARFEPFSLRIAFSADGQRLIATGIVPDRDAAVWIWDFTADDRAPNLRLIASSADAYRLEEMSTNGRWALMFHAADLASYRWDLEQADPASAARLMPWFEYVDVDNPPFVQAISPDGAMIAMSTPRFATTWIQPFGTALVDGSVSVEKPLCSGSPMDSIVTFDAAGGHVAYGYENGAIDLFDFTKADECFRAGFKVGHDGPVTALVLAGHGSILISGGADGTIRIWGDDPAATQVLYAHAGAVRDLRLSADGRFLLSRGAAGDVRRWDFATGVVGGIARLPGAGPLFSLPDGRLLSSATDGSGLEAWQIDAAGSRVGVVAEDPTGRMSALALDADATTLYSLMSLDGGGAQVQRRSLQGGLGAPETLFTLEPGQDLIALQPDVQGRHLLARLADPGFVHILTPGQAQPLIQAETGLAPDLGWRSDNFSLSADGIWLIRHTINTLTLWDVRNTEREPEPQTVTLTTDCTVVDFSVSRATPTLFIYDSCGLLHRVDLTAASRTTAVVGVTPSFAAVQFSPDGRWFAAAHDDGGASVWDLTAAPTAAPNRVLRAHTAPVTTLGFEPGGRWLVTLGTDGGRVWDLQAGNLDQEAAFVPVFVAAGLSGAPQVSADGRLLMLGRDVWILDPDVLVERACRSVGRNFTLTEWRQFFGDEPYRQTCSAQENSAEATSGRLTSRPDLSHWRTAFRTTPTDTGSSPRGGTELRRV